MEITPLEEQGHVGYLLRVGGEVVAVDPPLDTDRVVAAAGPGLVAIVETGVPVQRVAGGRLLAAATGAPLYGPPAAIAGTAPLEDGAPVGPVAVAAVTPGYGPADLTLVAGEHLFVGELDRSDRPAPSGVADRVAATRAALAKRHPAATAHGSAGTRPATDLGRLPRPINGTDPLNYEAVAMTNRGDADLFWADPRFVDDAPRLPDGYLADRAASPWAPAIIDLRRGGADLEGARRIAPGRLASELSGLESNREHVVIADDPDMARRAAGFLRRLGIIASST